MLYQPVHNGGNTKRTGFAVAFWYLYPADGLRLIIIQPILHISDKPFGFPFFKMGDGSFVNACGLAPFVFLDVAVGKKNILRTCDKPHQVSKPLGVLAVGIQLIQHILKIIVFNISQG